MILLFIGAPGSGKDTQAQIIAEKDGFEVISSGDLLRAEMKTDSEDAKGIKEYYDQGLWVPDHYVYKLLNKKIQQTSNSKIILTGAVRTANQVDLLDDELEKLGMKLDLVVLFELSEEQAVDRLKNRIRDPKTGEIYNKKFKPAPKGLEVTTRNIDADEQAFRTRFQENRKNNNEIVQKYMERNILKRVDASKSITDITEELEKIINT